MRRRVRVSFLPQIWIMESSSECTGVDSWAGELEELAFLVSFILILLYLVQSRKIFPSIWQSLSLGLSLSFQISSINTNTVTCVLYVYFLICIFLCVFCSCVALHRLASHSSTHCTILYFIPASAFSNDSCALEWADLRPNTVCVLRATAVV